MMLMAQKYHNACMSELSALKPGNVHIFADGHGMIVQDFIKSAEVSAPFISEPDVTVGTRIFRAIKATREAVACNTNLGIVLLAAPMMEAAYSSQGFCQNSLQAVLSNLTVDDAIEAYKAIAIANPAGLGKLDALDVHEPPNVTLLQAMQAAEDRDLIARQYSHNFDDIFNIGVASYQHYSSIWDRSAWATTVVYLNFLVAFEDTHIVRKHGKSVAATVRQEATTHLQNFTTQDNPKLYQATLMAWDADLKKRGINPGTSADMTVATMLANDLI